MPWEITIITNGTKIHSPYPERRRFNIIIKSGSKHPLGLIEDIYRDLRDLHYVVGRLPNYDDYVFSFCKYCDREHHRYCLRHRSVIEAPIGNESNWDYVYQFEIFPYRHFNIIKMHFEVGAKDWIIDGAVVYYYDERKPHGAFRIIRPSGKIYTYRLKPKPSSAWYIIDKITSFLQRIVESSYTYVQVENN